VPLNAFMIGFGNNSMSLLAGIMVLCTVFAIRPGARAEIVGAGNEGLTFVWMPHLFAEMPGGAYFMVLFFLALSFAALTSLISMLELATRVLIDFGFQRRRALGWVGAAGLVFGLPSALWMPVFRNQDWVWSAGLALSGLFFALAARRFGVERLRREVIAEGADLPIGRWWTFLVAVVIPVEAVALIGWWLWASYKEDPSGWLNPFGGYTVGAVLVQGAVALAALLAANRWLVRWSLSSPAPGAANGAEGGG
jgi:NSS family neurotransmitter:Na+ symporter